MYINNWDNKLKKINENLLKLLEDENDYGLPEDLFQKVKSFIDNYKKENGDSFELYIYNDELDDSFIEKMFESETPLDYFYDIVNDPSYGFIDQADSEYEELAKQIDLTEEEKEGYWWEIIQFIQDNISWSVPKSYYNRNAYFDIFLNDPEGANIEHSDSLIEYADEDSDEEEGKAISVSHELKILLKLQGHNEEEFLNYVNNKQTGNSFFDSIIKEVNNCTDEYGNQIVFQVQAPVLDMAKVVQEKGQIIIPSDANCGLVETFNGSGSILGINLEKDMTGKIVDGSLPSYKPREGEFEVQFYHGYSYNVDEIYGLSSSAWSAEAIILE